MSKSAVNFVKVTHPQWGHLYTYQDIICYNPILLKAVMKRPDIAINLYFTNSTLKMLSIYKLEYARLILIDYFPAVMKILAGQENINFWSKLPKFESPGLLLKEIKDCEKEGYAQFVTDLMESEIFKQSFKQEEMDQILDSFNGETSDNNNSFSTYRVCF